MNVKIIGGGIVGAYLAKQLGERAEIWEKNKKVKRKTCGGLISKTGLQSLNLPYEKAIINEVRGAKIKAGENQFTVEKKETQAYVLDMKKLKKELWKQAEKKGVEIRKGKIWRPGEEKKGEILIGADGAISQVAREKSKINEFFSTYQVITETNTNRDHVELYLGEYSPKFFGWKIPLKRNKAKIGIGTLNKNPKEAFKQFIEKENIYLKEKKIEREESAPIPLFDPNKKVLGKKWVLVGDAAGHTKATTGGGVVMGCKSAENLAKSIKEGELGKYMEKQREINKDLKTHLKIRRFLNKTNKEKLIKKIKKYNIDKLIEKHGDMDHPQELKKEVLKKPQLWPIGLEYLVKGKL